MTQIDLGYTYEKLMTSLRGFYTGAGYYGALIVLDRARDTHSGQRKNGLPEFSHQLMQATYLRTIQSGIMYPEATHITVLAHDMGEDYGYKPAILCEEIRKGVPVYWSGMKEFPFIETSLERMDKTGKTTEHYYHAAARDPIASIAKGLDRDHNISTMVDTFAPPKQRSYIGETRDHLFTMLKTARKLFPSQEPIYHNLAHQIRAKISLIERFLDREDSAGVA